MNEHQKQTEFLRQCLLYDPSAEVRKLDEKLAHTLRDLRCVQRAVWLMVRLTALAVAGLIYTLILTDNFPDHTSPVMLNLIYAVFGGLLTSLLAFMGLTVRFRQQVDQCREECRQSVARLLSARLGQLAGSETGPTSTGLTARLQNHHLL
jgi:hypothetical protein